MNCPICLKKLVHTIDRDGMSDYSCSVAIEMRSPNDNDYSNEYSYAEKHYNKYWSFNGYYVEAAIIPPYKIYNHFKHTEFQKPYSSIWKFTPVKDNSKRKAWSFQEVLTLPNILTILPYKRMQERLKTLLVFS